jgi:hypothetical protein
MKCASTNAEDHKNRKNVAVPIKNGQKPRPFRVYLKACMCVIVEGELSQAIKTNRTSGTHGEHIYALPYLRKKSRVLSAGSYRKIKS